MTFSMSVSAMTLSLLLLLLSTPVHAAVIEEIVAYVNGEIVTRSEIEEEEQTMVAEAYKRFTGEELDTRVKELRQSLLMDVIDRKILIDRARSLFADLDKIKNVYYEGFKESQGISDDAELERMLRQEGLTLETFKTRLLELYAPEEVLRLEVRGRISVGEKEIEGYYQDNPKEFITADEVTVREIILLTTGPDDKQRRREEAAAVVARVRGDEDFAAVASEVSDAGTKEAGGLLGPLGRGDLSDQLEALAFELPVGDVSDPVETDYGYHILKIENRKVGEVRSLEDVRPQLKRWLEERKYYTELTTFMKRARDEAEWCVKPKFAEMLAPALRDEPDAVCERL